ncbi:MAG: hypothetical protein HY587_01030 [Candidatus Omnitrophica bacterium]|nr:hypothetical protein [Candidatus Omnitrophota bacterium]
MARAMLGQELHLEAKNETGALGRVVSALSRAGVNIVHLLAYSVADRGFLQTVTGDNIKAKEILEKNIPNVKIVLRDVLIVEFENKVGMLSPVTKLLGNSNIFIDYCYGTSGDGFKIVGVFATADNKKAMTVINEATAKGQI